MRFMMLVFPRGYENAPAGAMPDPKAVEKMMRYNEELQRAGVLVALDGLHPPIEGVRVSFANGEPQVSEVSESGPREVVGGFWMIRVNSKEEAIEWARRAPMADNEVIEVRQVQELSEFPEEVQKAAPKFGDMQMH